MSAGSERQLEYLYLLTQMREAEHPRNSSKCLFVIPSTETWIFMDCSKVFLNATFFCEYTKQEKYPIVPFKVSENYCRFGWSFYNGGCHKLVSLQVVNYVKSTHLKERCKSIGSNFANFYGSSEQRLLHTGFLNFLQHLFWLENTNTAKLTVNSLWSLSQTLLFQTQL